MRLQDHRDQNQSNEFKCGKTTASFIVSVLACAASALFLAFWIIKAPNGFNSCPYIISPGCPSAYFSLKYDNSLLPLIILIAILISAACQFLNLILSLSLLILKINPSTSMRAGKCLLSSLTGFSSTISLGYAASFLFQLPQFASYGCTAIYDSQTLIILCSAAAGMLLFTLIELLLVATHCPRQVADDSIKFKSGNQNHLTDQSQDLFAPPLSKREKILRNRAIEGKKLQQLTSFQENTSFAELKNLNEEHRTKINNSFPLEDSLKSKPRNQRFGAEMYESLFTVTQKEQKIDKVTRALDKLKSTSVKVYPQPYQIQRENSELSEEIRIDPAQLSFVPAQSFAYPRHGRSTNDDDYRLSPSHKLSKSWLITPQQKIDQTRLYGNESSLQDGADLRDGVDRVRLPGQIQRNYERRLNALSPSNK